MVEEHQPAGAHPAGEVDHVADRRVAPADVIGVLHVGVLAVVDQEVGVVRQVEAGDPRGLEIRQRRPEARLVVRDVAERRVALRDPEAERRPAVVHRLRPDRRAAELPLGRRRVGERDRAGKLADVDRRQRRRDVARHTFLERALRRGGAPDRDLGVAAKARREEHEPLDVVEVEVGEEDADRRPGGEAEAEGANPGAGVEDDLLAAR